jgi:hypothetical protein
MTDKYFYADVFPETLNALAAAIAAITVRASQHCG